MRIDKTGVTSDIERGPFTPSVFRRQRTVCRVIKIKKGFIISSTGRSLHPGFNVSSGDKKHPEESAQYEELARCRIVTRSACMRACNQKRKSKEN